MKNLKRTIAYIAILVFCVFGFTLLMSVIEPKEGIEGYGIVMAIIASFSFFSIPILGVISLLLDITSKQKQLPKLTAILLIYPVLVLISLFSSYESAQFYLDILLLIAAIIAIVLIRKEIKKAKVTVD